MTPRRLLSPLLAIGLVALAAPASAYARPGATSIASVSASGSVGTGGSANPSISGDGRWVTFMSEAPDLVAGDTNASIDVFLHDRTTRVTTLVSRAATGGAANSHSVDPAISADGRFIAFVSFATNLVPNDTTGASDIFVFDRTTGAMDRVSLSSAGAQANAPSSYPSVSADGRLVAFASQATNLVPGDSNGVDDLFVRDRQEGITERISVGPTGAQGNGHTNFGRISADGRTVAFQSYAANLVPGDTNGTLDIFVRDRAADMTERASVASGGAQASSSSSYPTVSADGRIVTFYSFAADLVPADGNGSSDAFARDRVTGITRRVSVTSDGAEANGASSFPAVSGDGRLVAFESGASNLSAGDANGTYDVFVHDLVDGSTELVSRGGGGPGNGTASWPSLSGDGSAVAFHTIASNLAGPDGNGAYDVYVRDRGPALGPGDVSAEETEEGRVRISGWASFSGVASASAHDPANDGAAGASQAGAELTGASLIHRPELGDVQVRLAVTALPGLRGGFSQVGFVAVGRPPLAGAPAVVYGLAFEAAGARYEVRAVRAAATTAPPSAPLFALYRCEAVCTEAARLGGSIGSTSDEVIAVVPLSLVGNPGSLSAVRAFSAAGEAASGGLSLLDEVALGSAQLGAPAVDVALSEGPPASWAAAPLTDGRFGLTLERPAGEMRAWARACLGESCETLGPVAIR